MSFLETVARAKRYLRELGRVSLRGLMREFELDDEALDDLIEELVDTHRVAVRDGAVLAWIGGRSEGEAGEPTHGTPSAADAERRHLTVMFVDVMDSMGLSQRIDAENLRDVIRAYQESASEVIERYDGHVAQYLGDGLLVYFGYPRAHEDDAERALRAGLGIVEAMTARNAEFEEKLGLELSVRIGIHTGEVVVGVVGGSGRRETLALGEATNVAARLQAIAPAGAVVASAATLHLVEGLFATSELGRRQLKGMAESVTAVQVLRPSGIASRLEAAAAGGLTAFVGRDFELSALLECWERVREGRGQVVLIEGEAGIGKSRLIRAFRERLGDVDHGWQQCRGSSYHVNTALHAIVELLEQALDLSQDETAEQRADKLERGIGSLGRDYPEVVPLLADLLYVARPVGYAPIALGPDAHRRRTLEAIATWIVAQSEQHPLVFVAEDLHWFDPTSLELLGTLIDDIAQAPILLVLGFRPVFEPTWDERPHLLHMTLAPLARASVAAMARDVAGSRDLPAQVLKEIVKKTDGVPLFVEELTKTLLESGLLAERGARYERADPLPPLAIPETLQASLMARLDRLGPAKEVAQLASVLGREFPYDLLAAIYPGNARALETALARLVSVEVLHQVGEGELPQARFAFKHALIQDSAYQSLLRATRRQYHMRTADALLSLFAPRVAAEPEYAAFHYEEAGLIDPAVLHHQRAGELANRRSASAEAIRHFRKAIELLSSRPAGRERDERELVLQVALGAPLVAARGYANREVQSVYARARELCHSVGHGPELSRALFGMAAFYMVRGDQKTALELSRQLLDFAQRGAQTQQLIFGHLATGVVLYLSGDPVESRHHLERTSRLHGAHPDPSLAYEYGQDPGIASRAYGALTLWQLGHPDRALGESDEAIALGRKQAHPFSLAFALALGSMLCEMRGERARALERAEEGVAVSQDQGFPLFLGVASAVRDWARSDPGRGAEGLQAFQETLARIATTGTGAAAPYFLWLLAHGFLKAGRPDLARGGLEVAWGMSRRFLHRFWDSDLHRLGGQILVAQGDAAANEVEACFQLALDTARHQRTRSLELRAATSLARFRLESGRNAEAREILQPVYAWFTEGFETRDLVEARAVLEETA